MLLILFFENKEWSQQKSGNLHGMQHLAPAPRTAPTATALFESNNADADCKVAANPPAAREAWIVPTPETTVPNVLIATGTNDIIPTPKRGAEAAPTAIATPKVKGSIVI
jgi:hypothetical protein